MVKIYKEGNYVYYQHEGGQIMIDHAALVRIIPLNDLNDTYRIISPMFGDNEFTINDIVDQNDQPFTKDELEDWFEFNTGMDGFDLSVGTSLGKNPGFKTLFILGHNPNMGAANNEVDFIEPGNSYVFPTVAEFIDFTADGVPGQDDVNLTGTGMWSFTHHGLDEDWNEISEVIELNGNTAVRSTKKYLRSNFMIGGAWGSSGFNQGVITATGVTSSNVLNSMGAKDGISHNGIYTVPAGKILLVTKTDFNCITPAGGNANVIFKNYIRDNRLANPGWIKQFDNTLDTAVRNTLPVQSDIADPVDEKCDVRFSSESTKISTEVRVRSYCYLIDKKTIN